ncbi:MAG: hypothetical protein CSB49_06335 [Proteobacteria bacterium]|nr:MAG: hypothetical protein CSB49_06335 [Pseudomonadota bacterium]
MGLLVVALAITGGCFGQTRGDRVVVATAARGATESGEPLTSFTTRQGWTVKLQKAKLALGPIYFFENKPTAWYKRLLSINKAYAHAGGNELKGAVLLEVLEQYPVDLLASTPTDTGVVPALGGLAQAVELELHPVGQVAPGAPESAYALLGKETIYLEGQADKEGQTVRFAGRLSIPDVGTKRIVPNIHAELDLAGATAESGRLVLSVLVDQVLANVRFDTLTQEKDGVYALDDEGAQAHTALLLGLRSRYSYSAAWARSVERGE